MKKINVILMCLCSLLLFTGCYTNEFGDNGEPDVSKDVDFETLKSIHDGVDKFFSESATIDEMANHLNEIKAMNGIADAWTTDNALFVETNDGITNMWLYPTDFQVNEEALSNAVKQLSRSVSSEDAVSHTQLRPEKIAIINQTSADENREFLLSITENLKSDFVKAGFNKVDAIDQVKANSLFFQRELTSYDVIFLITHGSYSGFNGFKDTERAKHWILTGTDLTLLNNEQEERLKEYLRNYPNQVGYSTIKEKRNGHENEIKYLMINEDFIKSKNMKGDFNDAIIFNVACQSLKGSDAMANAFLAKGAKTYLGYDETNCQGHNAGIVFFEHMLLGLDVDKAFKKMEEEFRILVHDNDGKEVHQNANLKIVGSKDVCIIHPLVETAEAGEITSTTVDLNGVMKEWRETLDKNNSRVGFCWSSTNKDPKMDDTNSENSCSESVASYTISKDGTCNFKGKMKDLSPNTTYYYRPFLYMNKECYYGNVKEVKTKKEDVDNIGIREYLVRLYHDTDGDNWKHKDNWLSDKPVEQWYGVEPCSYIDICAGDIESYSIKLHDNNLNGTIDLSGCSALKELWCGANPLTRLDVSGCTALVDLSCGNNNLRRLDVSGCTALKNLECNYTDLTSLNVSDCTALKSLICEHTELIRLDVSGCTALKRLWCDNSELTRLDVSGCTALKDLWCNESGLTRLDVSGCTALEHLSCNDNNLRRLDVSDCTALEVLNCGYNNLISLNVSSCTALMYLYCFDNNLENICVSGCEILRYLDCRNNHIISEIPETFKRFSFDLDALYEYTDYDNDGNYIERGYIKNDYGWYYPGEPESRRHEWPLSDSSRRKIKKK